MIELYLQWMDRSLNQIEILTVMHLGFAFMQTIYLAYIGSLLSKRNEEDDD